MVLSHGDLAVDVARRLATRGGRPAGAVTKELAVLEVLLAADGAVVSAEELLEPVWDEHTDPFTNVIRMTVSKLRRKLGPPPIETVVGTGYRHPMTALNMRPAARPSAARLPSG